MCGGGPAWKREVVMDHKFDFVDVREFTDNGFGMRMKYMWLYIVVLKSFLVYVTDIFTAVTMLTTSGWSNQIFASCNKPGSNCISISFQVGKWLFVGCIIFSFLLLAYEARKSKKIVASRDISYAFTNIMAQHYYSLRSYDHFCFFDHLSNSTKKKDDFAFWIFFTFKSWKQLLLADGPRQCINGLTLFALYQSKVTDGHWYDVEKYFKNSTLSASLLTVSTFFTVLIFAVGLIQLIIAGILYIPWLCYIRGNLKEYVCHKVDKRITEVIKRRNKQRLAKARALAEKEAAGDFSHLKNKKGQLVQQPLPQPTLPNISLDDEYEDDASSMRTRGPPASTYTAQTDYYYQSDYKAEYPPGDYPPMPAYNQPYQTGGYPHNMSGTTFAEDQKMYDDDYSSTAHLALAAAPFAQPDDSRPSSLPDPYAPAHGGYAADPYDAYQGNTEYGHAYGQQQTTNGLAYDDSQGYPNQNPGGPQRQPSRGQMGQYQDVRRYETHQQGWNGAANGHDGGAYGHAM